MESLDIRPPSPLWDEKVLSKDGIHVTEKSLDGSSLNSHTDSNEPISRFPSQRHVSEALSADLEHGTYQQNPYAELVSGNLPPIPFRQRIKHFTWAWYTLTMSTGGVATLISVQPHPFPGLLSIGASFYLLNLILFLIITVLIGIRFCTYRGTLRQSLQHDREGLFFGPFWLSLATIITGTQKYVTIYQGQHDVWLTTAMAVAFWTYVGCTFIVAVLQYSYLFSSHMYHLDKFMPSWLLPIFPIMLAGTIAAVIAGDQPLPSRYPILFTGLACQGLGFTVCVLMYVHYIGRLMCSGLPNPEHRPAMFIGVGPPSFTALALLGMANAIPDDANLLSDLSISPLFTSAVSRLLATVAAISLWLLALWFFCIAALAVLFQRPKLFHLGWWAMVFPNSGFTIATVMIANAINSEGLKYLANGMTIAIVAMWVLVLFMNARALMVRDIMYPHMDEDADE